MMAAPIAANTAGQQRPTSASGTTDNPGRQRSAERGGDAGVVGDLLGVPDDGHLGGVVVHRGQRLGTVDAGGDGQHRTHRGRRHHPTDTTGAPPSRITSVSVNRMSIQVPESVTFSTTA